MQPCSNGHDRYDTSIEETSGGTKDKVYISPNPRSSLFEQRVKVSDCAVKRDFSLCLLSIVSCKQTSDSHQNIAAVHSLD